MSIGNESEKVEAKALSQDAVSSSFNVFCLKSYTNDSPKYSHWSEGLEMFIEKDGVNIKFNSEEIQKIVKSLPRTIGGSY